MQCLNIAALLQPTSFSVTFKYPWNRIGRPVRDFGKLQPVFVSVSSQDLCIAIRGVICSQ